MTSMDFETYSEAGFILNPDTQKWHTIKGANKKGLSAVGTAVYVEHPTAEILSLAYNIDDGNGDLLWVPGIAPPELLFNYLAQGGVINAWNCEFEWQVWAKVAHERLGWPALDYRSLRDPMSKARAWAWPGALGKAGEVSGLPIQKDKEGKRLLTKFSIPRNATKKDSRLRIRPEDDVEDAGRLYSYNLTDIQSESALDAMIPELPPEEELFRQLTVLANLRGVAIDHETVLACISILDQAYQRYNLELANLTGGAVPEATQVAALIRWLATQHVYTSSLDEENIKRLLADPRTTPPVKRALQIRQMVGSAGVKKVYSMARMSNREKRLCSLLVYHGARTGRDTGRDIQPQNLVKQGPAVQRCPKCDKFCGTHLIWCPYCGDSDCTEEPWSWEAVPSAVEALRTCSLDRVEELFGNAVLTVSGCIRGLFVPKQGHDFVCSDYSSIEAVVAAVISGEQWRIEAFQNKVDIYLASASEITGIPVSTYEDHKVQTGQKHSDRGAIGKVAELGLGFGGWINAWRQFDSTERFTDEEVKQLIIKWREASPAIVETWGGQCRGKPWAPDYFELYGLEGMAIAAIQNPGQVYTFGCISYYVDPQPSGSLYPESPVLYAVLPSGRKLAYHKPQIVPSDRWDGQVAILFEGWNSNPQMGPLGWVGINTFGGRLFENVVQAIARDYLRDGVIRLEAAGYPIVMRIHDELVAEVPEGWGSIEEFEQLMQAAPEWAQHWPVRAAGGWRAKRYRKD